MQYDFPHKGREDTARKMYALAQIFKADLGALAGLPFPSFHAYLRKIPYISDEQAYGNPMLEVLGRPGYLVAWAGFPGLDCKKKAILTGAWAENNGIPWKLIGMSERKDKEIHHVFPVLWNGTAWVNVDATYPNFQIGAPKPGMTAGQVFTP